MASVDDVAAYILEQVGEMTTMKLQKLCYYSQGWSLAWDGVPLFKEPISAWANGPVVYHLFDGHRGRFRVDNWPRGDSARLSQDEVDTIDGVLHGYAHLSGQQLSDKTHRERPWLQAREGLSPGESSSRPIPLEEMQDFFGGLAALG